MKHGFVNVLKPSGMNSNYAVVGVRRLFEKGTRVGHMGTLDPAAAGVLPIGIGFGARLFNYIIDKEKEYICELQLGITTDTQDAEGRVLRRLPVSVDVKQLEQVLEQFRGTILQTPPAYSAVVKNGQKLYAIARSGGDTTVAQRPAQIFSIEILNQLSFDRYLLRIRCGRGTYVRTLCHDIGQMLHCGAICSFLLRTQTGVFTLDNSKSLEEYQKLAAVHEIELIPADYPIQHMAKIEIPQMFTPQVKNGLALRLVRFTNPEYYPQQEPLRIYLANRFIGLGQCVEGQLKFISILPPEEFDV